MLRLKAAVDGIIIKKKLRVHNWKSSIRMKRITRIKKEIEILLKELNDEGVDDADRIKDEMENVIQDFQFKLSSKEAALLVQQPISQRGPDHNIILNHDFSGVYNSAYRNSSKRFVVCPESGYPEGISKKLRLDHFVVLRNRKNELNRLELDITDRILPYRHYTIRMEVAISEGPQSVASVGMFVDIKYPDSTRTTCMKRTCATTEHWESLEYTPFSPRVPHLVTLSISGVPPEVDLLIKTVSNHDSRENNIQTRGSLLNDIIRNPKFISDRVLTHNSWSGRGCKVVFHDSCSIGVPRVFPKSGKFFISTENRTNMCNGIQHEITGKVQRKLAYEMVATVRIYVKNIRATDFRAADVRATLWVQTKDLRERYIGIGSVQVLNDRWVQLQGKFLLNCYASRALIYLEGPPSGTDILLDNLVVKHAAKTRPALPPIVHQKAFFGVNIISNSNLYDGTNGWSPLLVCSLSIKIGSPYILPPMAVDSLGRQEPLSGRYILVTNRTWNSDGPAQIITAKVKPYVTYQVSAWVRIDKGRTAPEIVNVGIHVDYNEWVSGGKVEINDDQWNEIGGSFRIENQPTMVKVCVQGPTAGVDFMVAGLQIFPVDRRERFRHLRKQTDRIRKRDVTLQFTSKASSLVGTMVKIRQTHNSFTFGSRVNLSDIDNEDFVDFFSKNFDCVSFRDELKWFQTDREPENYKYKDADAEMMLDFCTRHNIQRHGHSIVSLLRAFTGENLRTLSSYNDAIMYYDVKEMMNGSFTNQDKDQLVKILKIANIIEPSTAIFIASYGLSDHYQLDKYVDHILELQKQGAPIGGIGIKGVDFCPIGPIICDALNKLAMFGLPIWFSDLEVCSGNDYVRADDLEIVLREAFAHNAVKGVMLSGFWELLMNRENAHLVNAEGEINEAGKRYLALKQEWLSRAHGHLDDQGRFKFRGFHGSYNVEVVTFGKKVKKTFVIEEGEDPIAITINF